MPRHWRLTFNLDDQGIELTPEYMHQALRRLAMIDQNPSVTGVLPFSQQALPIFA